MFAEQRTGFVIARFGSDVSEKGATMCARALCYDVRLDGARLCLVKRAILMSLAL